MLKAAAAEYLDTYADGSKNGAATDKLVAALELVDVTLPKKSLLRKNSYLRNLSGSSVVTDGHTTSDSVVLTMY